MKTAFEKWLKSHENPQYIENTIRRYIMAMEKAEQWLGITLPIPLFSITDMSDYQTMLMIVHKVPDYKTINQSHGHGDLSAALNAYSK